MLTAVSEYNKLVKDWQNSRIVFTEKGSFGLEAEMGLELF